MRSNNCLDQFKVFSANRKYHPRKTITNNNKVDELENFNETIDILVNYPGPSHSGVWRINSDYKLSFYDREAINILISSLKTSIVTGIYIESDIQIPGCCISIYHSEFLTLASEIIYLEIFKLSKLYSNKCNKSKER